MMDTDGVVTIAVELYDIPVVAYKSFGEAVRAGVSSPVALRARDDSVLIRGQRVVAGCWGPNDAAFLLSAGRSIHIFSRAGYSDWQVADRHAYDELAQGLPWCPAALIASFVTPDGTPEGLPLRRVDVSDLVARCIGKEVLRIAVAHTTTYLQFRGTKGWQVFFEPVRCHDDGAPRLLWGEDRE